MYILAYYVYFSPSIIPVILMQSSVMLHFSLSLSLSLSHMQDFENFYEGVSIETSKDSDFISELRNSWTI